MVNDSFLTVKSSSLRITAIKVLFKSYSPIVYLSQDQPLGNPALIMMKSR
jgi:hypothetical protein